MKTRKVKTNISYGSKPDEFAILWEHVLHYVRSYEYEIDKLIWVGQFSSGWVSVFPGSPGDCMDPDVPLAIRFHVPDFWEGEPEDLSENTKRFNAAYDKRLKWLIRSIKSSWSQFEDRAILQSEAIDGKLGIYFSEYFECLSLPALTYVCGTRIKLQAQDNEQRLDFFCKKYDIVRYYFFPMSPGQRNSVYLDSERMDSSSYVKDLAEILACYPKRTKILLAHYSDDDLPPKRRNEIEVATGKKVVWLTEAQEDKFLEAVDSFES